jgi:hypothetical protein
MKLKTLVVIFVVGPGVLVANRAPDAFDRVVVGISAGIAAERRGNIGAMREAAEILRREGAAPTSASPDVAARWLDKSGVGDARTRVVHAPYRDRALGAGYRMIALAAGATVQFDQTFLAGQRARVAVVPLTKADFSLSIRDDDGQSVCAATPLKSRCDWVPVWTTRYAIRIANPGKTKSDYYVVVQ